MTPPKDSWDKYQLMVLDKLDTLERHHEDMKKEVTQTRVDIGQLKVKSGVWGAIAGLTASIGVAIVALFR